MTVGEIVERVIEYRTEIVILTGGEPSLQPVSHLVEVLHKAGRRVHIETNGTRPLPAGIDWVTCSPKEGGAVVLDRCDELKVVYTGQDVEAIRCLVKADHLFLQPCSGCNTADVIAYILEHPWWRLSLQTHKLLDIR